MSNLTLKELKFLSSEIENQLDLTLNHDDLSLPDEQLYKYPFGPDDRDLRDRALFARTIVLKLNRITSELESLKMQSFVSLPICLDEPQSTEDGYRKERGPKHE